MKSFRYAFVVNSGIEDVWKFYTDINHLKIITPKEMGLKIIEHDDEILKEGAEAEMSAKLVTKSKWRSKITYIKPYEYVDEMMTGRFRKWKHKHTFEKITDNKTEVVDQIEFELPYGVLGRIFENYVMGRLSEIFKYRQKATVLALESKV
ncbi:MAG: SRPBCC family protein [Thaumarchaeota archaeon]|nr:SRPBCC family protein [Nitrososphaerota archaeon]